MRTRLHVAQAPYVGAGQVTVSTYQLLNARGHAVATATVETDIYGVTRVCDEARSAKVTAGEFADFLARATKTHAADQS